MHRTTRHRIFPALAALALFSAACAGSSPDEPAGPQAPWPATAGIQTSASLNDLVYGRGWSICYEDTYAAAGGPDLATIVSTCPTGYAYLALACGVAADDQLTLVAADRATVVTQLDATVSFTEHHVANGVGWYLDEGRSWGFFPATEAVYRNACDYVASGETASDKRLCWQWIGGAIDKGFRCGATTSLQSATWRRVVLSHP